MTPLSQLGTRLHDAGIPIHGVSGDPKSGYTVDYTDDATDQQKTDGDAIAANFTPTPDPNWRSLKAALITPGNSLYESVRDKMAATKCLRCADQFQSLKMLVADPALWNEAALGFSINTLASSLSGAGQPLSPSDINGWNTLMSSNDFPANCQLPTE